MEKKEEKRGYQFLLTSGVIAAIITGIFSLIVSWNTNEKLKDIESQKHQYALHEMRFERLHESLEYFARFKMYDSKYIDRFDISSEDYSTEGVFDMLHDSTDEFTAQLNLLNPYLSDEALVLLEEEGVFEADVLKTDDMDIENTNDDEEVNAAFKEHMKLTNKKFDDLTSKIIKAISYDLYHDYFPE